MQYNEECKLMVNKPYYKKEDYSSSDNNSLKKYIFAYLISFIIFFFFFIYYLYKSSKTISHEETINENNFSPINETLFQELSQLQKFFETGEWTISQNISQSILIPKFSVIIPVYNSSQKIKKTIRSIQYQNITDIEIILTDDNSEDNSISIIEQLQKEDSRIKLLKSKNNKGILYSRSIGVLNAKGKYIFSINAGDIFINDIFKTCHEIAELNDIDIIEFSGYNFTINSISIPNLLENKENNKIIFQPELSNFMYKEINNYSNYEIIDGLIWGKFIKNGIYKNSIDMLNFIIFNEKVIFFEDKIINFGLFRKANSFQFINKKGIIHICNETNKYKNLLNINNKNQFFIDYLKYVMSIFKLTQNSNDVKLTIFEFINVINLYNKDYNEEYKKFMFDLYKEIKGCENINEDMHKDIENKLKKALDKEGELNKYKNLIE